MARLQAIFLGLILLPIFGCNVPDRVTKLEKETQDLKAQVGKQSAVVDYDLQAKCSQDAKAWFNENYAGTSRDKNTILLTYSNHYQKTSNECLITVEYHFNMPNSWFNDISLWNVYENSKYGAFVEVHSTDYSKDEISRISTCEVTGKKCKTIDEFNNLTQPYMSN